MKNDGSSSRSASLDVDQEPRRVRPQARRVVGARDVQVLALQASTGRRPRRGRARARPARGATGPAPSNGIEALAGVADAGEDRLQLEGGGDGLGDGGERLRERVVAGPCRLGRPSARHSRRSCRFSDRCRLPRSTRSPLRRSIRRARSAVKRIDPHSLVTTGSDRDRRRWHAPWNTRGPGGRAVDPEKRRDRDRKAGVGRGAARRVPAGPAGGHPVPAAAGAGAVAAGESRRWPGWR